MDLYRDRDGLAQGLGGMAGSFGVFDKETDLFGRCRAANSQSVGDLLEGTAGTFHTVLVSYVKFGPDIGLHLLKGYVVEGREARHLRDQAERGAGDEILQGSRPQLGSAARGGFVGLKTEFADATLDVHVLKQLGHGADGGFATAGVAGKAGASLFVDLAAFLYIDAVFGFVRHAYPPCDLSGSASKRGYSIPEGMLKEKLLPRNKQGDCLHKASHLIAHRPAERAVVIGDHAPRLMVIPKKENQPPKEKTMRRIRNRMVYNDWGLYRFVQMLTYKCLRFGKELHIINAHDTTRRCHVCRNQTFEHVLKGR